MGSLFPLRTCLHCGATTTSTSTIDRCVRCGTDGLRPRHFLTRHKDENAPAALPSESAAPQKDEG